MGEFPSGQRGQTVNLLAYAYDGSNPSPSTSELHRLQLSLSKYVRSGRPLERTVDGVSPPISNLLLPSEIFPLCPCGSVVEHSLGKGEVMRSIRIMGTTEFLQSLSGYPGLLSGAKHGQG